MPSIVNLKALGLNTQPNQLEVPPGSLKTAKNVIIRREDVIESRRGFKIYGNSLGSSTDRAKQLLNYKDRIIRHYASKLAFDSDNEGTFVDFDGSYSETQAGLRIKSIEANSNLYFTSSEGIKKISAKTADDFTANPGFITDSGGIKAIDLSGYLKYTYGDQTSFLTQDGAVAYRVVWGITDANNNLILGTPSQRLEIYNPLLSLLIQDFSKLLLALDNINQSTSLITDGNYVSSLVLPITASASDLRDNLLTLTTKIDNDILYANTTGVGAPLTISTSTISSGICTINFSAGTATNYFSSGSLIYLSDFSPTTGSLNGAQTIATVSATSITFNTSATGPVTVNAGATIVSNEYRSITQPTTPDTPATDAQLVEQQTYISAIIDRLLQEPNGVIPTVLSNAFISDLDVTKASTVILNISIPEGVTTSHFYQIYRSQVATATAQAVLSTDVFPSDELQLVYEAFPTQSQIDAKEITIEDVVPDAFRGANLYTNASTGEGILQANDVPPFAKDVAMFKNYVFYANTKTRQRKNTSLIGVQNIINDYNSLLNPSITISDVNDFSTYLFVTGLVEETDITTTNGASLVSSASPGSYFLINSGENENKYYVWYQVGSSTDPNISGRTGIKVTAFTTDTSTQIAERTRDTLNTYSNDFIATSVLNVVSVSCVKEGYTDDASAGTSGFTISVTQQGRGERATQEINTFTCVADVAGSLAGLYFTINSTFNQSQYYVWFKVNGSGVDPAVANKVGILVNLATNDSAATVATKISTELNTNYSDEFTCSTNIANLTITNVKHGPANNATVGTSGFTLTIDQQGTLEVLLSTLTSPAQAVEETANSLIRIVNKNTSSSVYGFYLSGAQEVPGKLLFESKNLNSGIFYLLGNTANVGNSFSPDLSPDVFISSISTGSPTTMLVTTSTNHGLTNQDIIEISGSDCIPSIDGYHEITYVSPTTFRINKTITTSGTTGGLINIDNSEYSSNEEAKNRIYYSKLQQPEAVPIVNYFDVGPADRAILRIFPLRDSLFVFKEDGVYRISGESIPFNLALFDSGCNITAADSVASVDNIIYLCSRQGISSVTEAGVRNISRPIDVDILPLFSSKYPNVSTATWGVGYESDNSYVVFTVTNPSDVVATQAYRYNTLTNTFTTYTKTNTCGIVNSYDDKLYLGAGDVNYIEQERKNFSRLDYADREYQFDLLLGNLLNNTITLLNVDNVSIDDIMVQEQLLSIYTFNMLLKKLDIDPGVNDTDYYSTLKAEAGADLRDKIVALATKLDSDSGVADTDYLSTISDKSGTITLIEAGVSSIITSANHGLFTGRLVNIIGSDSNPSVNGQYVVTVLDANKFSVPFSVTTPGTTGSFNTLSDDFIDVTSCYNKIIEKLNADIGVAFTNYSESNSTTTQEARIISVNKVSKVITLDKKLDWAVGPLTLFKAIQCEIEYSPITMDDPLGLKHLREATVMFQNFAFSKASLSFASDLLPKFEEVEFEGDGNGIFGFSSFGSGFFGGGSNFVPFRTYVPRNCQRCRFLMLKFKHKIAREQWAIYGITITGEVGLSTRAFR